MERQARHNEVKRNLLAALLVVAPIALAGCEERPAYVLEPDRSQAPYPVEHRAGYTLVVREGDSISRIAQRCDTSTDEILRMNDLDESRPIYPGQILRVPSPPRDEVADSPRPQPRPRYETQARYEVPAPIPRRRPVHSDMHADAPPPPPPVQQPATDDHGTQQSWWSSWWKTPSDDQDASAVKFTWPVRGRILQNFGPGNGRERNDGINIATEEGTPIRAAAAGTVTYTGNELKGYGKLVLIRHPGGFVTAYAHAGSIKVSRGDVVAQGQVIGTAGESGDVDRPQLHFEIRRGVQAVDPERYLGPNRAS